MLLNNKILGIIAIQVNYIVTFLIVFRSPKTYLLKKEFIVHHDR